MTADDSYDIGVCQALTRQFLDQELHRPMRVGHYDAGKKLNYQIKEQILNGHLIWQQLILRVFVKEKMQLLNNN